MFAGIIVLLTWSILCNQWYIEWLSFLDLYWDGWLLGGAVWLTITSTWAKSNWLRRYNSVYCYVADITKVINPIVCAFFLTDIWASKLILDASFQLSSKEVVTLLSSCIAKKEYITWQCSILCSIWLISMKCVDGCFNEAFTVNWAFVFYIYSTSMVGMIVT